MTVAPVGPAPDALLVGKLTDVPKTHRSAAVALRFLVGYKANTRAGYANDLNHYFAWCASSGTDPLAATRSTIDLYSRHLAEAEHRAPATIARRLSTLAGYYKYAMSEDLLTRNPCEHVRRPRVAQDSATLGLDREQARAMLRAAEHHGARSYALVTLLMHDGLRISEALGADVEALGDNRGHRTLTVLGKGGKRRTVVLNPTTRHALDTYIPGRDTGPIFTTRTGLRWNRSDAYRTIQDVAHRAGIPHAQKITPHSLRHTFVTLAREAGVPLEDVQDAAGHADPRTTRRYDRGRHSLDRHPAYALGAYLAQ
jgi:integrase/recombinase XerD